MRSTQVPSSLPLLRAANRLTQAELAQACGVSSATLSNVERGLAELTPELTEHIAGAEVWPSHNRLARLSGISVSTVKTRLGRLEKLRLLRRRQAFGDGGRQESNRYTLDPLWERLAGIVAEGDPSRKQAGGTDES